MTTILMLDIRHATALGLTATSALYKFKDVANPTCYRKAASNFKR